MENFNLYELVRIRKSLVCIRVLLVCYSYVTRMLLVYYSYVTRMLLVCYTMYTYVMYM